MNKSTIFAYWEVNIIGLEVQIAATDAIAQVNNLLPILAYTIPFSYYGKSPLRGP